MNDDGLLLTDLYQLTMLQSYFEQGMNDIAVFEFFVRKLPPGRNFLIAGGLEQVVEFLARAHFSTTELEWLASCGRFRKGFVDSLADWRFSGAVDAMPEGTVFFPDEPILRVVAPLREAQLVETRLINLLQFQTMVASKAVRCVLAAEERRLIDFGLRRAHGSEAGLLSARASYLAGFAGTATVLAGMRWNIPLFGTMAHSYIQAHDREQDAFEHFARTYPAGTTLLVDTYDTDIAVRQLVSLAQRLQREDITIGAVRIDSGDLRAHAANVRRILDAGQLPHVAIIASGNLDEYKIRDLVAADAPIDSFGVGTRMNTSADAPFLDCAYKLQEYAGRPRRKRSIGKATWPGRKQVWRAYGADGRMLFDTLSLQHDRAEGEALLQPVTVGGQRVAELPALPAIRDRARDQLRQLPQPLLELEAAPAHPVQVSRSLHDLARKLDCGA